MEADGFLWKPPSSLLIFFSIYSYNYRKQRKVIANVEPMKDQIGEFSQ